MKSSLLAAALFCLALAQTADVSAQDAAGAMNRVGIRLACQCGCPHTVATCDMFECGFSKPAKERIAKLQKAGMADQAIVDQFIADYGQQIYRKPPSALGWLVPYLSVIPGLALIWWFIRRYRKPRAIPEIGPVASDDPALAKYNEQIEKDLAHLD